MIKGKKVRDAAREMVDLVVDSKGTVGRNMGMKHEDNMLKAAQVLAILDLADAIRNKILPL